MQHGSRCFVLALILGGLGGCASAHIVSQRDPAIADESFGAVLVDAALPTLAASQAAELRLSSALTESGYLAFAEEEVFFPQRDYSEERVETLLDEKGVDAVLVLRLVDAGYESRYIPPTVQTSVRVTEDDDSIEQVTTTEISGGYDVDRPWANFVAELVDRSSGDVVWYAELEAQGRYGLNHDQTDLARASASRLATQLEGARLLRPAPDSAAEKELSADPRPKPLRFRRGSQ